MPNPYEQQRLDNIARNEEYLRAHGLLNLRPPAKQRRDRRVVQPILPTRQSRRLQERTPALPLPGGAGSTEQASLLPLSLQGDDGSTDEAST